MSTNLTKLYTDGACWPNPGNGGWGAIIVRPTGLQQLSGSIRNTTNQRMELNAACSGLRALPNDEPVTVYTDSMYVIWAAKNRDSWAKKHAKGKLTNADLWLLLQSLLKQRKAATEWQWVRGHNGDYYNEMADGLAEQAARQ